MIAPRRKDISPMTDTAQQEALEFEGETVHASRLTFKGALPAPSARPSLHRDESIAILSIAKVDGVSFETVKDATTRTHKASVTKASVVDLELATDLLDEQFERSTGQLKLLSMEGESRRAAREVLAIRQSVIGDGVIAQEDEQEDPAAFASWIEDGAFTNLAKLVDETDAYDLEAWLARCQDELAAAGATILAGIEWCRRRQAEHIESQQRAAAEAAQAAAERTEDAAAVHSDDEADKRERRGVENVDGGDEDEDPDA